MYSVLPECDYRTALGQATPLARKFGERFEEVLRMTSTTAKTLNELKTDLGLEIPVLTEASMKTMSSKELKKARAKIEHLKETLEATKLKAKQLQDRFPVYVDNAEVYLKQCGKRKAKFDKGEAKAKEEPCATFEEYKQTMKMTRMSAESN